MQELMNQKMEQLDKAMQKFNTDNDRVQGMKREYDQLIRKAKTD